MDEIDFDEDFYLSKNKDVLQAVSENKLKSGFDHYKSKGYKEYRSPTLKSYNENKLCLSHFCSLGVNCEFGMVQRKFHFEPLDLLRWAGPSPDVLIKLLHCKFDRIDDPNEISLRADGVGDYYLNNTRYNYTWHAWEKVGGAAPEAILNREVRRLPFLSQKLMNELAEGKRIFVVKRQCLSPKIASDILEAMHIYGRPKLVFVTDGAPIGLKKLGDSLYHGTIPRFADGRSVGGPTLAGYDWLALCKQICKALGYVVEI